MLSEQYVFTEYEKEFRIRVSLSNFIDRVSSEYKLTLISFFAVLRITLETKESEEEVGKFLFFFLSSFAMKCNRENDTDVNMDLL